MKTTSALSKMLTVLLTAGTLLFSIGASAQNLIVNPGFDGTSGWSTDCSIEIYAENVYGGTSSSNNVTEIDIERCFNQQVSVSAGAIYDLSYKASRRTGGSTPATTGVNVTIAGVETGTVYLNQNRTYTNTAWGYTTENFSFTLPASATDTKVNIKFSNYITTGTYGTIIDDVNFYVDAQSSVLPLKLTSFSGEVKNNNAILSWTASNDDRDGRAFVIERMSAMGKFDSIAVIAVAGTDYSFTDRKMLTGSNKYRLKIVSRASVTYSKIISLSNAVAPEMQVFPNPATTTIGFRLNSASRSSVNVAVYSLSGAIVSLKQVELNAGSNMHNIDISLLRTGSFFLKISDANGTNYVQEFCKR